MNQKLIPVSFISDVHDEKLCMLPSAPSVAKVKNIHNPKELSNLLEWYMQQYPDKKISIVVHVEEA